MTVFQQLTLDTGNRPVIRTKPKPAVLVTPLDWGLGHATRCIPVIRHLLVLQQPVLLGGSGDSLKVLRLEFPDLPFVEFPPYNMRYPKGSMVWNIAMKTPRLIRTLIHEKRLVSQLVKSGRIKAIISDNRYGCFHPAIPSALITHQVYPIIPVAGLEKVLQRFVLQMIKRFDSCWIPDMPDPENSLAGKLAHPPISNARFTGPLSRLFPRETAVSPTYRALFLLSGPEPQRTYLEAIIRNQVSSLAGQYALVQGLPDRAGEPAASSGNLTIFPFVQAEELSGLIADSSLILCRAGYSTLMDLAFFGKKAVFVPTPGQTEQIYLAEQLANVGRGVVMSQETLHLAQALDLAEQTREIPNYQPHTGDDLLASAVQDLLVYS